MDALTLITIALADGLWQVGKKMLEATSDSVLKPAKEQLEGRLLKGFRSVEKDERLLGAIKEPLAQMGAPFDDGDQLANWLNVGLDKLQAKKNNALRCQVARAVVEFVDPSGDPPADLMTALRWPRGRKRDLAKLLAAWRAAFVKVDDFKSVIAYADSAHQNGLLRDMLASLSQMEDAFVQSDEGAYLRVAVVNSGLTTEQAMKIERVYRDGIQNEFRKHIISGLAQVQKAVSLPLEDIYLELGLIPIPDPKEREQETAEFLELPDARRMEREMRRVEERVTNALSENAKIVIVGKPGSGKTISLKFIALMLAEGSAGASRLGLSAPFLPVFVRLADYAEKLKTDSSLALETFLLDYIDRNYPGAPRQGEFLRLALDKGGCMILLDGLDEVGDIGDTQIHGHTLRMETLKQARRFASRRCNDTCSNRMIVTSRLEGYRRGDLPDFREMEISPLRVPDEAEAFLLRWFTALFQERDPKLTFETAQNIVRRSYLEGEKGVMHPITQHDSIRRLAMNPLLLTILAIIYEMGKRLPNRRVELYEIVAKTMIENWRHSQTGHVSNIYEKMNANEVYYTLAALAYWLHENKPGGTMSSADWQAKITELLKESGHNEAELKTLVEHFLHHARQETGLLTERSLDQIGFFHLTLEEYMAAVEIARQDTDKRLDLLKNHWMNPRWQEVILLTAGELDQRGNKQALEAFLLHALHLEDSTRGSLLAGRALADVGARRVKDTVAESIRTALKHIMWDADSEGRPFAEPKIPIELRASAADTLDELGYTPPDLYQFAPVEQFYIAKHPVTNLQYKLFLDSPDFADEKFWLDFPKFDEKGQPMKETWGREGLDWLKKAQQDKGDSPDGKIILPRDWNDPRFGIARRTVPVVGVTWWEANAFCKWLTEHWMEVPEYAAQKEALQGKIFRLPTESEWVLAAGGEEGGRYPWDEKGTTKDEKEILRRANTDESGINRTTPVGMYPLGKTPKTEIWDMAGNVWEWQANFYDKDHVYLGLRGGSWSFNQDFARVSGRCYNRPYLPWFNLGFRVVAVSPPS